MKICGISFRKIQKKTGMSLRILYLNLLRLNLQPRKFLKNAFALAFFKTTILAEQPQATASNQKCFVKYLNIGTFRGSQL